MAMIVNKNRRADLVLRRTMTDWLNVGSMLRFGEYAIDIAVILFFSLLYFSAYSVALRNALYDWTSISKCLNGTKNLLYLLSVLVL